MNGVHGMGVQFLFRTPDVRAGVDRLVTRLEDRLGGRPPEAPARPLSPLPR
jgi:hypothetical protein